MDNDKSGDLNNTIANYNDNAIAYFESSIDTDLSHLYAPFLEQLPKRATILDAGCGSGIASVLWKMAMQ